jgi:hypothetical protein
MLILIIIYILWRGRCKCKIKRSNDGKSEDDDYDMEFWLNHIDKQKLEQKNYYHTLFNPTLPEACSDSRQATAAWIIEHRKLWINMHKHDLKSFTASSTLKPKVDSSGRILKGNNEKRFFKNSNLITRLKKLNPLKSVNNKNQTKYNKAQLLKDLDCQTQLLIDYARIDAITNKTFNKLNITYPTTSGITSKQNTAVDINNNNNKKQTHVCDNFETNPASTSCVVNNFVSNTVDDDGDGGCDNFEVKYIDNDSLMIKENYKLAEKYINSYRRRSHSWPRCKFDNRNHMSNYERLIKLNFFKLIYNNNGNNNMKTVITENLRVNKNESLKIASPAINHIDNKNLLSNKNDYSQSTIQETNF